MANNYSVAIIGGGPAAFSAGIYLGRANLNPLILTGTNPGGQLAKTSLIENYPGFKDGVNGADLIMAMQAQAEKFNCHIIDEEVNKLTSNKQIITASNSYATKAIIIATGAEPVWLNLPNEQNLIGKGVSTCAVCDAAFYKQKHTLVVGGGDSAMVDALALAKFATSVTLVHRRDKFKASPIMVERILHHPNIKVLLNSSLESIQGDTKVIGVTIKNLLTQKISSLTVDGIFIAIGHQPSTEFIQNEVDLDEQGYIKTNLTYPVSSWRESYPTMTNIEGIFAAGDCVDYRYRQAIVASSMGVMAAIDAEKWLNQ